jgi:hypothetical protein
MGAVTTGAGPGGALSFPSSHALRADVALALAHWVVEATREMEPTGDDPDSSPAPHAADKPPGRSGRAGGSGG